jgi:FkbM family methyltransferase
MTGHVAKVLNGEYDIPELKLDRPLVLDLGANVGAFAVWAARRWPGAHLYCYEPNPDNYVLLEKNTASLDGVERAPLAVLDFNGEMFLRDGKNNCGECSFFDIGEQADTGNWVRTVSAANLPPFDFMKIDTEGSELLILQNYQNLSTTMAVVLEWHGYSNRIATWRRLDKAGFRLISDEEWAPRRGIMKWIRS